MKNQKTKNAETLVAVHTHTHTHTHTGSFRKRKKERGITLIALVITIIVLIILAGISITMISGQDGILNRASSASVQSDIAGTKEQIQLELMGKYDTNGEYTNADVITAVKNATGNDVEEKAKTVLSKKGNEVDISDLWVTASTTGGGDTTITDRTGIQVGDYVDYTPDSASAYSSSKLAESITGSSSNSSDLTQDTLTWQVLRIYDNGAMDLIGSPTSKDVYFYGSLGYNNGVYVMNDICESLYSKKSKGITARSVNLDDMEKWLTTDGIKARNNYSHVVKYGEPKTYTGSYSYRPDIFGKTENESDKYYTEPTTNTYSGGNSSDTLDVKQTYYYISINSTNYGDGAKVLTASASNCYWVASRCVDCFSDRADFELHIAYSKSNSTYMFRSSSSSRSNYFRLRPVVSLGSNIQITPSSGTNGSNNMHTINWN